MLDKSGNDNHAVAASDSTRPLIQQDIGGYWYLSFDGSDDQINTFTLAETVQNDVSLAVDMQGGDFVMKWASGTVYMGIGQSGSSSLSLAGGENTPRKEYFDNVLSTNTTRGQNYTSGQATNLWLGNSPGYTGSFTVKLGVLSASFPGPERVYQALYREGEMTEAQRNSWSTFALAKIGITYP
jgi:hypothetical protein